MKKTKTIVVMLVMLLASASLFAMGAREQGPDETLIKVESVIKDGDHLDIIGFNEYSQEVLYHTTDDTSSRFSIDDFCKDDYLLIKDTGIMTMSIPAQLTATEIRRVTFAVNVGLVGSRIESPAPATAVATEEEPAASIDSNVLVGSFNADDMIERFNYSYGYLTMKSLYSQNITPNASYFARGAVDAAESLEPMYDLNNLNTYIDAYVNEYYNAGITTEPGDIVETKDELLTLEATEDTVKRFSYAYGYYTTFELLYSGIDIVGDVYANGLLDAAYGAPSLYTEEQMQSNIEVYAQYLEDNYNKYIEQIASENLAEAEAFLNDNKAREGVVELPSGVQLEVTFSDATGDAKPTDKDTVIVDYTLRLLDGTIVDQGEAVEFPLTSLIPGFVDAVINMNIGDSATAYIPPELGYGENGASTIEPNTLLIFDISLKGIKDAE